MNSQFPLLNFRDPFSIYSPFFLNAAINAEKSESHGIKLPNEINSIPTPSTNSEKDSHSGKEEQFDRDSVNASPEQSQTQPIKKSKPSVKPESCRVQKAKSSSNEESRRS